MIGYALPLVEASSHSNYILRAPSDETGNVPLSNLDQLRMGPSTATEGSSGIPYKLRWSGLVLLNLRLHFLALWVHPYLETVALVRRSFSSYESRYR